MTRDEALAEWDSLLTVRPVSKDSITPEAEAKASVLFAALYPEFENSDEICANTLLEHSKTVIRVMAQAYQALMNKEQKEDD